MHNRDAKPIGPEPILGVRTRGLFKGLIGVVATLGLYGVVSGAGLLKIPIIGHYCVVIPGAALTFALIGFLELLTGRPLNTLSKHWEGLGIGKQRVIAVIVVLLVIAVIVVAWVL